MERAYSNRPDSKSGNLNPASLHVWNARDRDWMKRQYGSPLAFRVMQNYMQRQHRIRTKAIRKFIAAFEESAS
jgi:hypothetical protein